MNSAYNERERVHPVHFNAIKWRYARDARVSFLL
jgi:hypothetical protein